MPYVPPSRSSRTGRAGQNAQWSDDPLGQQLLGSLSALTEQVSQMREVMATREDLDRLVSLEVYNANRTSDGQRVDDHGRRLTAIEQDVRTLERTFYRSEITDARQLGQLQVGTQQQLGQVQSAAQQGNAQTRSALSDMLAKSQQLLIGALTSGFIALLVYALNHR